MVSILNLPLGLEWDLTINIGACAVMESMAYMMERFIAPLTISSPDYPYTIAEKIVEMVYPELGKEALNVIALCDVSLLTSAPGHTLICYLVQFKEDGWIPAEPEDLYRRVLEDGFKVKGSKPCVRTYEKPSFILDIARGGDFRYNKYLKFLIEEYIGTPIITNHRGEATIKSPIVHFDSDFFLFPAIGEIIKLFEFSDSKCALKECCARLGGPNGDKCDSEPWSHEVRMDNLCPYSLLWHNWKFKGCKPVKSTLPNNYLFPILFLYFEIKVVLL